jgi:YebC/PmpR family DNA-binding regulatory protein
MGRQWLLAKREVASLKKSKSTGKFVREITIAARQGGADPENNARLFAALEKARAESVSKDVIERAINKGAGIGGDKAVIDHIVFEGYAPHKVPVIVECLTDNKNRTTQEIKHLITKNGFELGAQGSAQWAFTKAGGGVLVPNEPLTEVSGSDEESLGNLLSLFDEHGDVQEVYTNARGYERTNE